MGADDGLLDPAIVAGAQVLADKGNGGLVEGIHGDVDELLDVGGGGVAGHHHFAEGVDGGLDHHVGKGEQDPLEAGRQADPQNLPQGLAVDAHCPQIQVQRSGVPYHAQHHQRGGDALGDDRGDGHAGHIQFHDDHEEEVQNDVHHAGQREEVQRPPGVSLGPQQRSAEVIDHGGGHAQEVDAQIQCGKVQHIGRGLHPDEDGPGAENAHHGQQHAADDAQEHGGMYGFVEFLFITGAVVFGSQRIGAHGKADEEVGQKTDEGGVGAHGGQ